MLRKRLLRLSGLAALLCALPLSSAHAKTDPDDWPAPVFTDASVHDPSVIKAEGQYYVFGSHLAAAKTVDWMQWEKIADGATPENPLFNTVREELAETFDWAETDTLWAADVIQLGDGRYYMYYNASRGDSPRSAMGLAVADNVEGPYENLGIFLLSGMWGAESEDGTIYDARVHPNVVDPDAFFDAEGTLWMVYGSYSGGLFIFEMDPESGFPLPGQGYGKHLMGGNHSRIEAPYMLYSPETEYYYLFSSFGGLAADGGYNIRVARSRTPDGPFFDAEGNNMAAVKSDPSLPLFDDASIEPYGVKIMGNHLFARELGEAGAGIGSGYKSPGHNSAFYDEQSGRYFLIFHSRFPTTGEYHAIRVHEFYLNDSGWPVVSPYRYAGGGTKHVLRPEVAGDYKLLSLTKAITAGMDRSQFVRLTHYGRVEGDVTGRWWFDDNNRIALQLNGAHYDGVLSYQWNETAGRYDLTFSAVTGAGTSVWGSRLPERLDSEIITAVLDDITFANPPLLDDIALPTKGTCNSVIEWQSSAPQWLASDGTVTRPEHGEGNKAVTLTATVTYNGESQSRSFEFVVREQSPDGLLAHYSFDNTLADATGQAGEGTVSGPNIDTAGGQISYAAGVAGEAAVFDGASGIRLPNGLIGTNQYSVAFWVNPSVLNAFTTTFFGAAAPDNWLSVLPRGHDFVNGETMLWSGVAWYDAGTGVHIPAGFWSHLAFTVSEGEVRVYVDGVLRFSGSNFPDIFTGGNAVFSLGVNWWDQPYEGLMDDLKVYESVLSEAQIYELYIQQ